MLGFLLIVWGCAHYIRKWHRRRTQYIFEPLYVVFTK